MSPNSSARLVPSDRVHSDIGDAVGQPYLQGANDVGVVGMTVRASGESACAYHHRRREAAL
jgi:hypothetical protein